MSELTVVGIEGIPDIYMGDDLAEKIICALNTSNQKLEIGDIVVITSKIVSKAEGRFIRSKDVEPSAFAQRIAQRSKKSAREIEVILQESSRPVKITDHVLIMETLHGFVCANAGVDQSNVIEKEGFLLLPKEPDRSAERIREALQQYFHVEIAVIISDTFGRPWRMGQTNVAIGVSGMDPIVDYRGTHDMYQRELSVTEIAIADELAGAAELVMGKADGIPVAIIRGYAYPKGEGRASHLIRPIHMDLFR